MVSKTDLNYCVPILYAQKILEAVDYEVSKFMANMPQLGSYAFSYVCVLGLRPDPEYQRLSKEKVNPSCSYFTIKKRNDSVTIE